MSSSVFHALILTVAMVVTEVIIELVCMRLLDGFLVFTQNSISYAIVSIGSRIFYFFVIRIIIVVFAPKKERLEAKSGFTVFIECHSIDTVWLTLDNCSDLYEWPYRFHNGWNAIGEYGASSCYEFCCILGL